MATQLRLLENPTVRPATADKAVDSGAGHDPDPVGTPAPAPRRPIGRVRRPGAASIATNGGPIREPLDSHTRERGLRGVAAARLALADANRRVAVRDAERRREKDARLIELAGRARMIASSPDVDAPTTPQRPDGNAAA